MDNVTIYSIAEQTGVSAATVSRVLNNNPHVKPETRDRILKALDEAGYVPNDTARNLVTRSSMMIGVLVTDIRETQQSTVVHTIEQEFTKHGYSCLIYNTGTDSERLKSYVRLLSQKKVDGVVLIGSSYKSEQMKEYINTFLPNTPIVTINGQTEGKNIYNIFFDMKHAMISCIDLLRSKGRKRIGYIYGIYRPSVRVFEQSAFEYMSVMNDFDFFSAGTQRTPEEMEETCRVLLKEHPDMDGLIFADDYIALGCLRPLMDAGKRIPEDIAIIGIGNTRYGKISNPKLTSLDGKYYDCSLKAVRTMIAVLGKEDSPRDTKLQGVILERETS